MLWILIIATMFAEQFYHTPSRHTKSLIITHTTFCSTDQTMRPLSQRRIRAYFSFIITRSNYQKRFEKKKIMIITALQQVLCVNTPRLVVISSHGAVG